MISNAQHSNDTAECDFSEVCCTENQLKDALDIQSDNVRIADLTIRPLHIQSFADGTGVAYVTMIVPLSERQLRELFSTILPASRMESGYEFWNQGNRAN